MRCRAIRVVRGYRSELKSSLACTVCKSLHTPVEPVSAAVEHSRLGAGFLRALRQELTGALGLLHAAEALQVLLGPVHGGDGAAGHVVDELCLDTAVRAEHRQP